MTLALTHVRKADDGMMLDSRTGMYSTELAKMIGITPAWLTFSGM